MSIDWASMTDEEIVQELAAGQGEKTRRRDLAAIPGQTEALNLAYLNREGVSPGMPWRQPTGSYDAYPVDWVVTHNDKTWRSVIPGNVWEPGVAGWREEVPEGEYPEWVQPVGAPDAYAQGDEVAHAGSFWRSNINANVWEPPEQWTEFTPGVEPPAVPAWVQPTGAHDAYNSGDQVTHNGNLWTSQVDGNVWEPPTQWTDEGPYSG